MAIALINTYLIGTLLFDHPAGKIFFFTGHLQQKDPSIQRPQLTCYDTIVKRKEKLILVFYHD